MALCPGCEALPAPIETKGILYLCPPLGHTVNKLRDLLESHGVACDESHPGLIATDMESAAAILFDGSLPSKLSVAELASTRCLILDEQQPVSIADLARMQSLQWLLARARGQWLTSLIAERRLATFFQPIVHSERPEDIFGYECLVRGMTKEGCAISPDEMFGVARDAGMLFPLDRAVRLRHIRSAVEHGLTTKVFINFNPTAIYDPTYCLRSTVHAIGNSSMVPDQFVFEVIESDAVSDPDHLPRILDFYRDNGYLIALDDFGAGYGSLNLLTRLKPDFIKLDMHLLRNVDIDPYKSLITAKLLEMAKSLGVQTIAEGIETAEEYHWALKHGADFVQGYLFGRPASVPEEAATAAV